MGVRLLSFAPLTCSACSHVASNEGYGREGRRGGLHVSRSRATEEERVLQVRRRVEFEVEEEACDASSQGHQSIYQGAMRLQSEACVADCEGPCTEEIQGRGQLIELSSCPRCAELPWVVVCGLARPILGALYLIKLHQTSKAKNEIVPI